MPSQFNWERVLRELRIEVRTSGANVGSGELNIRCPWCGTADPSFHLGINLVKGAYRCWRNKAHAGRSPRWLLTKLVGHTAATAILRKYGVADERRPVAVEPDESVARPTDLVWPAGCVAVNSRFDSGVTHYLAAVRGFHPADVESVCALWGLRVGRYGEYSGRLVIPYHIGGQLVYYTARAMTARAAVRYKACPNKLAVEDPHAIIFNEDALGNPAGVILCEGPLDAIKATTYAPLPAVAMSTNSLSAAQLSKLRRARRVIIMVDNDHLEHDSAGAVTVAALVLYNQLFRAGVPTVLQPVPGGYKDLAAIPYSRYPELFTAEKLLAARR